MFVVSSFRVISLWRPCVLAPRAGKEDIFIFRLSRSAVSGIPFAGLPERVSSLFAPLRLAIGFGISLVAPVRNRSTTPR